MKSIKFKNAANAANSLGSILLCVMFAVSMLLITAAAIGTYSRLDKNYDGVFGGSAAVKYVGNKIKSADDTKLLSENAVAVYSGGIMSVIYFENGELYEHTDTADTTPQTAGGEPLFSLDNLNIAYENGFYGITAQVDDKNYSVLIRKG